MKKLLKQIAIVAAPIYVLMFLGFWFEGKNPLEIITILFVGTVFAGVVAWWMNFVLDKF